MRELAYFVGSLAGAAVMTALALIIRPESPLWKVVLWGGIGIFTACACVVALDYLRPHGSAYFLGGTALGIALFVGCGTAFLFGPSFDSSPLKEPELESLSNSQLRGRAHSFATEIRTFASGATEELARIERKYPDVSKPDLLKQRNDEYTVAMRKIQNEWEIRWRPRAIDIRDVISRKLGRLPPYAFERDTIAIDHPVGNPMMMFWAADYLDSLARQLPP